MNLVPETALVYGGKTLRDVKKSLSLKHQHQNDYKPPPQHLPPQSQQFNGGILSLGCGNAIPASVVNRHGDDFLVEDRDVLTTGRFGRRRHLATQDPSMCNNSTNFYCWMTCMDIPRAGEAKDFSQAGYSLYCADESIVGTSRSDGTGTALAVAHDACIGVHNSACKGLWEKTVEGVPSIGIRGLGIDGDGQEDTATNEDGNSIVAEYDTENNYDEDPFCYGGTTMYMEGFQFLQSSTCVIMLFPSWVLNTPWKYLGAVLGTIVLAIGLEKLIQQRRKAAAFMKPGTKRLLASAAFYGVQLSIGYVLMLIIMIYSVVLFFAVVLGLVIGHALFNAKDAVWPIYGGLSLKEYREEDKRKKTNGEHSFGEQSKIETNPRKEKRNPCCSIGARRSGSCAIKTTASSSENTLLGTAPAVTGGCSLEEDRAIREGSTHCQSGDTEYYGSLENIGSSEHDTTTAKRPKTKQTSTVFESTTDRKREQQQPQNNLDPVVPEGCTPCCQHGP